VSVAMQSSGSSLRYFGTGMELRWPPLALSPGFGKPLAPRRLWTVLRIPPRLASVKIEGNFGQALHVLWTEDSQSCHMPQKGSIVARDGSTASSGIALLAADDLHSSFASLILVHPQPTKLKSTNSTRRHEDHVGSNRIDLFVGCA
jgi:hypothetical protein